MTIKEAISYLEDCKFTLPNNDNKKEIERKLDDIIEDFQLIRNDLAFGGPDFKLPDNIAKKISNYCGMSTFGFNQAVELQKCVGDFLSNTKAIINDKREAENAIEREGGIISESIDYKRIKVVKFFFIFGMAFFVLTGVAAIVLCACHEKFGVDDSIVDMIVSSLGLADFIMGGLSFFVERLSDLKAKKKKNDIAKSVSSGKEDINNQTTSEDIKLVKERAITTIINIDQRQFGICNIRVGKDDDSYKDLYDF